jgi:hypothetical protein
MYWLATSMATTGILASKRAFIISPNWSLASLDNMCVSFTYRPVTQTNTIVAAATNTPA